ncbi:unnamed protein product [Arctogadus glacialis]
MQVTNSKPISSRLAVVYTHLWYPWSGKGSTFIYIFYPKIFQCDHHGNVKNTIQRTGGLLNAVPVECVSPAAAGLKAWAVSRGTPRLAGNTFSLSPFMTRYTTLWLGCKTDPQMAA